MKNNIIKVISVLLMMAIFAASVPLDMINSTVSAFSNEEIDFLYSVDNDEVSINGFALYDGIYEIVDIPETIDYMPVTKISESAFSNRTDIVELYLPSSIKTVGENAFNNCCSLEKVVFANGGVVTIDDGAFGVCESLKDIILPEGLESLGVDVFYKSENIENIFIGENSNNYSSENGVLFNKDKTVIIKYPPAKSDETYTIPETVTKIESWAFSYSSNLIELELPSSVTSVCDFAFYNCSNIKTVTTLKNVVQLGGAAFENCYSLTNISALGELVIINPRTFKNCTSMTEISIPNSVKRIEYSAFQGCTQLEKIIVHEENSAFSDYDGVLFSKDMTTIVQYPPKKAGNSYIVPDTVTEIGVAAFANCNSLEKIVIPESVNYIRQEAFSDCESLSEINLPNGLLTIEYSTFNNCSSLENISIPETVTSIGNSAFENCMLLSDIIIPDCVKKIGSHAFYWCNSLNKVSLPKELERIGTQAFSETGFYKNSSNWTGNLLICDGWLLDINGENIVTIELTQDINHVADDVFLFCSELESVTIYNPDFNFSSGIFETNIGITLIGYSGSTTETFAIDNDIPFLPLAPETFDEYIIAQYGKPMTNDPFFLNGINEIQIYNNLSNGKVAIERVSVYDTPTGYDKAIKITTKGDATPGQGGFCQSEHSQAGAVYYQVFVAKVPIGYTVERASNQMGYQVKYTWITPNTGTGDWQTYVCKMECGIAMPSASYGYTFGHIYLIGEEASAGLPVEWYVCYSNIFDATGYALFFDTNFSVSSNGMGTYNNMGNGATTLSRVTTTWSDCPSSSPYMMQIQTKGETSPGLGGFFQEVYPVEGCTYYHKFCAKIPVGYKLAEKMNRVSGTVTWLTEPYGTGDWETYIYKFDVDKNTEGLGTFGFVALYPNDDDSGNHSTYTTNETVTWYVAAANVFTEDFPALASRYTYNTGYTTTYNGHLYIRYDNIMTWEQAEELCRAMGGHLATITSADENNAVLSICSFDNMTGYYLGGTDKDSEGTWRWITGEPFSYATWASGQPDNYDGTEHVATIWNGGSWNDLANTNTKTYGFICEIEETTPPSRTIEYNGNIYSLYNFPLTWSEAKSFCESMGGHLVTITDAGEQLAVARMMHYSLYNWVYTGATDIGSEGAWKWVTGEPFSFTNWAGGEPNNNDGQGNPQNAGCIYKWNNRTWDDGLESYSTGFICEFEASLLTPADKATYNGNHYEFYKTQTSWETANAVAESKGGHLVTISSAEENQFIVEHAANSGTKHWLGFRNPEMTGNFEWITGEAVTYTNWNSGEPNNSNGREYYAHIYSSDASLTYLWNDETNRGGSSIGNSFIIEYDNSVELTLKETDGTVIDSYLVPIDEALSITEKYVKKNRYVSGWYLDSSLSEKWEMEKDIVTDDLTLYAQREHFKVSYYSDEVLVDSKYIYIDETIGEMPVPEKAGYTFLGWYNEHYEKFTQDYVVYAEDDINLYACWIDTDLLDCGEGLTWSLDGNALTIEGNGRMYDFEKQESPWSMLKNYISTISIGSGVENIGENAFYNCYRVFDIVFEDNISEIGNGALERCNSMQTVTVYNPNCVLPENINTGCSETVFYGYTNSTLNTFATSNSLGFSSIGNYGTYESGYWLYNSKNKQLKFFGAAVPDYGKDNLPWRIASYNATDVVFEDTITYIGDNVLSGFSSVSSIEFSESLTDIGINALEDTKWFKDKSASLILVGTVLYAYKGAEGAEIVIGSGIEYIAKNFSNSFLVNNNCPEKIQIPHTVVGISEGALAYADNLKYLVVNKGNPNFKTLNNVLYSKDGTKLFCYPAGKIESFQIPDSVTEICPYAFAGCEAITEITVGKNITSIGEMAFDGTSLQTVYGYYGSFAQSFAEENGYNFVPFTSTVTFDCNDADGNVFTVVVNTGCPVGDLYVPSQPGYEFVGWYLETDYEDTELSSDHVINEDITVYAYWDKIPEEAPYIIGIEVTSYPDKRVYYVGDTISTTGLKLNAIYSNGEVKPITSGFYCLPNMMMLEGTQNITVAYAGFTTEYTVTVNAVEPSSITIEQLPKVLTYFVESGDSEAGVLNTKGLIVRVEYNNGTSRLIRNSNVLEYIYDFSQESPSSNVNVIYTENGKSVETFYQVKVLTSPDIYSSDISGFCGEEIAVPVYISGNTGIMGYSVKMQYDPAVLIPEGLSKGVNSGEIGWDYGYGESDSVKVIWCDTDELTADGLLFTAYFKINSRAKAGETAITITHEEEDTFNGNYENVSLNCSDVSIVITENSAPIVYSDNLTSNAGEYVDIPVMFQNNCGILDLTSFVISFDGNAFSYSEIIENGIASVFKANGRTGKVTVFLNEFSPEIDTGCLFTVRLKTSDNAIGKYSLSITMDDDNWNTEGFSIDVKGKNKEARIYAEPISVRNGESFNIPVIISGNSGIMGYKLSLKYNENVFSFEQVVSGQAWTGNFDYNKVVEGQVDIIWNGSSNIGENGILFTVSMLTKATAPEAESVISVSYSEDDTYDESWENIVLNCEDIAVTVSNNSLLMPKEDTFAMINNEEGFVCGILPGSQNLTDYFIPAEGCSVDCNAVANGETLNVLIGDTIVKSYKVIIFGDTSGDGMINHDDLDIITDIIDNKLSENDAEQWAWIAADCNHDGEIDEKDALLIDQAAYLLNSIPESDYGISDKWKIYSHIICQTLDDSGKEKIILSGNPDALEKGKTASLKAFYKLAKVEADVEWSSSDRYVASVSADGLVKAQSFGKTTIYAVDSYGRRVGTNIQVYDNKAHIIVGSYNGSLRQQIDWWKPYSSASMKLYYRIYNCSPVHVKWTSDNSKVNVDSNGNITNKGMFARKAKITVTAYDSEGLKICSGSVVVSFYKFDWQTSRLQTQSVVSDDVRYKDISEEALDYHEVWQPKDIFVEIIQWLNALSNTIFAFV